MEVYCKILDEMGFLFNVFLVINIYEVCSEVEVYGKVFC